jgi:ubiquinone/menaquinone biosynthesis C-methylase UbiE
MESTHKVAHIFDDMRDEYDDLSDLWYAWLFSRLHYLIAKYEIARWPRSDVKVLDIGCGTGFQSFLYASVGASVHGIDVSNQLVEEANEKASRFRPGEPLFPEHFGFVRAYNRKIKSLIGSRLVDSPITPIFSVRSALETGFPDNSFDHVNCCGSVLSFIDDHTSCLREMSRVLRPGGTFVLEVEGKYNLDLFWPVLDAILGGKIGYEMTLKAALAPFKTPLAAPVMIEFPFGEKNNPIYMDIKLFSKRGLRVDLAKAGLQSERWRTIHSITNLIPSTSSDTLTPSPLLTTIFRVFAFLEEISPISLPGASFVIFGYKKTSSD